MSARVVAVTVCVAGVLHPTPGVRFAEVGAGVDGRVRVVVVGYEGRVRHWMLVHGYDPRFYVLEGADAE